MLQHLLCRWVPYLFGEAAGHCRMPSRRWRPPQVPCSGGIRGDDVEGLLPAGACLGPFSPRRVDPPEIGPCLGTSWGFP